MTYENKDVYKGRWKNGMVGLLACYVCIARNSFSVQKNGSGKLVSALEGTYEGSWEDDLRHGAGKLTYPNRDVYEGGWERNKVCIILH